MSSWFSQCSLLAAHEAVARETSARQSSNERESARDKSRTEASALTGKVHLLTLDVKQWSALIDDQALLHKARTMSNRNT